MAAYRGPPAAAWTAVELDPLTAVFHRPSGITHLLVEPAPQLLRALADRTLTVEQLRGALAAEYDLPDDAAGLLPARLEELVAAGFVERA